TPPPAWSRTRLAGWGRSPPRPTCRRRRTRSTQRWRPAAARRTANRRYAWNSAAAEADVGAALRQADMADRLAFRIEDAHAIELVGAHAPAAPQIAVDVDSEAVG